MTTTTDDKHDSDESDSQGSPAESVGLVHTTGASFDQPDDWVVSAIESGDISEAELKEIVWRSQQPATPSDEPESPANGTANGLGHIDHNTSQPESDSSTAGSDDSAADKREDSKGSTMDTSDAPSEPSNSNPETETTETQPTPEAPDGESTEAQPAPETPATST